MCDMSFGGIFHSLLFLPFLTITPSLSENKITNQGVQLLSNKLTTLLHLEVIDLGGKNILIEGWITLCILFD